MSAIFHEYLNYETTIGHKYYVSSDKNKIIGYLLMRENRILNLMCVVSEKEGKKEENEILLQLLSAYLKDTYKELKTLKSF
jgi:hypothetical protein